MTKHCLRVQFSCYTNLHAGAEADGSLAYVPLFALVEVCNGRADEEVVSLGGRARYLSMIWVRAAHRPFLQHVNKPHLPRILDFGLDSEFRTHSHVPSSTISSSRHLAAACS